MKRALVLCILLLAALVCGCSRPAVLSRIEGYDEYLDRIGSETALDPGDTVPPDTDKDPADDPPQEPEPPDEEPPVTTPEVRGLRYIGGGYSYGTDFSGGYARVDTDAGTFLLNTSGQLLGVRELPSVGTQMHNGYYAAENDDGLLALAHIGMGRITDYLYDEIAFSEGTYDISICRNAESFAVYRGSEQTAAANTNRGVPVHFSRGMLLYDGKVCDEYLMQPRIGGYYQDGKPADGMLVLRDETREGIFFGYADTAGDIVIDPQFIEAEDFRDGYAVVRLSDRRYAYIDKMGEFLRVGGEAVFFDTKPAAAYDGFGVAETDESTGTCILYGQNFSAELPFIPVNKRVYGRYAIDGRTNYRFYDFRNGSYSDYYDAVYPAGECFVTYDLDDDDFRLLGPDLQVLTENCDKITYADGIFTVEYRGFYYYYEYSEELMP